MTKQNNKAFTLVELIVVITILAVLATVAFISFQGYTSSSRDSVRLTDLKNISKSFEVSKTRGIDFPLPDKKIDISASGTIFQYQGELSQNILESHLNMFGGGVDPLTKKPYGYSVNLARNKFQVIGFLENKQNVANISTTHTFADNSDKFVKTSGNRLGIILDETTNDLITQSGSISEIDIESSNTPYGFVINNNLEISKGENDFLKNEFLFSKNPIASCKTILYSGKSRGNGIYSINPDNIEGEQFDVYCDMENNGGGWTLYLVNREDTRKHTSSGDGTIITYPNYNNWDITSYNDISQLENTGINIVSPSIEKMKFNDIRFECTGEECLGSGIGIYSHQDYSLLEDKTGVFTVKGDLAWPFDVYHIYKTPGSYSASNRIPYNELTIGGECVAETTRPYEACVQIGLTGVDRYDFQNSIGLGVYGKEWYNETLEINAPFGYIRHRMIENLNANIWIK